jgi:two-component system, OmpR family, response regulator
MATTTTEPTPYPTDCGGLRVLCVDDNADAADSLGMFLELLGYEVTVTHDAPSALEAVAAGANPQACVLDITMPGMDGCGLANALRSSPGGEDMLLIALTALGDYGSMSRMADSGFDLYFQKPVVPRELLDQLVTFAKNGRPT